MGVGRDAKDWEFTQTGNFGVTTLQMHVLFGALKKGGTLRLRKAGSKE